MESGFENYGTMTGKNIRGILEDIVEIGKLSRSAPCHCGSGCKCERCCYDSNAANCGSNSIQPAPMFTECGKWGERKGVLV